jgi:error-prone DNA polymerase
MTIPYVELHAHSAFSFLDGASTPIELANKAAQLGYSTFALTDHDGLWGSMEFAHACVSCGLRPITGAEVSVRVTEDSQEALRHLTLLAESASGYRNLCRLLTIAHADTRQGPQRNAGQPSVDLEQLEAHAEGLVCLSGCAAEGVVAGAWARRHTPDAARNARRLFAIFGADHLRVELQRPYWRHDRSRNRWLIDLADRLGVGCVATGNVHSHSVRRAFAQDALVAIRLGQSLESCEPEQRGNHTSALVSPDQMAARLAEYPAAVAETLRLAERLTFDLTEQLGYRYPGADDEDADRKLATLAWYRLSERYAGSDIKIEAEGRLTEELGVIRHLQLSGFFLLHHDLLELAREVAAEVRGPQSARAVLPPGRGRGSSVSSIVCYLTGLSHVDPVQSGLFAGRFLNEESTSMPDIDLDFPRDIREVLIPRVHRRYGAEHSALVAAYPTYRPKGAVRELGKALGLWPKEVDAVARVLGYHGDAKEIEAHIASAIGAERAGERIWKVLAWLCEEIMGLPRHASQHPGGMIVSTRPLIELCPTVPASMEGRQIVQWDKDSCADAGFLKIDLLGLGMLSAVERAVDEIARVRDERVDLSRIPLDDEETFRSIRAADTTGVFQIESRAQMQMLPRTQPRDLDDLTVQVALVRPGPIQGGAIHPYIERRKRLREDSEFQVPYPHPLLEPVLKETLGTIVFQEQVIETAMALSGFSSSEAEGLRRAMSRKRSQVAIDAHYERFISGAMERGASKTVAEAVWAQIEGFSGFGFPKAHSAAFGLLAYQSAWLRMHFGPEFLTALLNEQPMGFYPPDALVHEAQRRGILVVAPDVNESDVLCRVQRVLGGLRVRIGLGYIKGVREEQMRALVGERERHGPYKGIADLASRSGAGQADLERLAWAGALDAVPAESADVGRRSRYWQLGTVAGSKRAGCGTQLPLPIEPAAAPGLEEMDAWQLAVENYRATKINLGDHPLALLRHSLGSTVVSTAALSGLADGVAVEVAGLVIARQRPETARGITFLLIEDECSTANLIVGRQLYERCRSIVRSAPLVLAKGRLEQRDGAVNVVVNELRPLDASDRPRNETHKPTSSPQEASATRLHRVAELRAVAPTGHNFG